MAVGTRLIFILLFNPLNAELNPIWNLLALLGAHPILHVSRIRVKLVNYEDYTEMHGQQNIKKCFRVFV